MTNDNSVDIYSSIIVDSLFNRVSCDSQIVRDNFKLKIKIFDDTWANAQFVDYKIANLVIALQKDVVGYYNLISNTHYTIKNIHKIDPNFILKVEIENGCIQAIADLANFFKAACDNMTGAQKLAAIGIVCSSVVIGHVGTEYVNYLRDESAKRIELESKRLDESTKLALMERLGEAYELATQSLASNTKTQKSIYESISENGTVSFGSSQNLSKQDLNRIVSNAKFYSKNLDKKCHNSINIDNNCDIVETRHEKQTMILRHDLCEFEASTRSINSKIRQEIADKVMQADIDSHSFATVSLNVVADVRDGKVFNAFIVGVGSPRDDNADLQELLAESFCQTDNGIQKQASLPKHMLFSNSNEQPLALPE